MQELEGASPAAPFVSGRGQKVATLILRPTESGRGRLFLLSEQEMWESGQERIQLEEGGTYEFTIEVLEPGLRLDNSSGFLTPLVGNGRFPDRDQAVFTGFLEPGLSTGLLQLQLLDSRDRVAGVAPVEVRSTKLSYDDDYRSMLDYIAEESLGLLMDIRQPSQGRFSRSTSGSSSTLHQRFAYLRALIASRRFREAMARIFRSPYARWDGELKERELRRGLRPGSHIHQQLARPGRRVALPPAHPLYGQLVANGVASPSVPKTVMVRESTANVDNPENRFVKHVLLEFASVLADMDRTLRGRKHSADERVRREIKHVKQEVARYLAEDLFKDVGQLSVLPLASSALQGRPGYRDVLATWFKFHLASELIWSGADDVFGGGKRDVAALYEYWVFLKLLKIVAGQFDIQPQANSSLIERTADGIDLKLKMGTELLIDGQSQVAGRFLRIRFGFNQTFSTTQYPASGSWSRPMRPDCSLTIWPEPWTLEEADRQEIVTRVHFDAKYRIDKLRDLFGTARAGQEMSNELDREKALDRSNGRVKRSDLLKMHAYKDSIRRSFGAYVIYPGEQSLCHSEYEEILPGIGAFSLRPAADEAAGTAEVATFLRAISEHVADEATRREQLSYHLFRIEGAEGLYRSRLVLPRSDTNGRALRDQPPAERPGKRRMVLIVGTQPRRSIRRFRPIN